MIKFISTNQLGTSQVAHKVVCVFYTYIFHNKTLSLLISIQLFWLAINIDSQFVLNPNGNISFLLQVTRDKCFHQILCLGNHNEVKQVIKTSTIICLTVKHPACFVNTLTNTFCHLLMNITQLRITTIQEATGMVMFV